MKIGISFTKSLNCMGKVHVAGKIEVVGLGEIPTAYVIPQDRPGLSLVKGMESSDFDTSEEAQEWAAKKVDGIFKVLRKFREFEIPENSEIEI